MDNKNAEWVIFWKDTDEITFRGTFDECWDRWIANPMFGKSFMKNRQIVLDRGHTQCFDQALCRADRKSDHFRLIRSDSEIAV